jgi:hypothetical protein
MKMMIPVLMLAAFAVPGLVHAQASQVTATATVANYAAVTGSGNLDFGTLSRTADMTVLPSAGALRTVDYNHNVRVTFANVPTHLTANAGTLQLPVALTCAFRVGAGSWSAGQPCDGNPVDLDVGPQLTQATLGFGGTITAANVENAVAATYTGTLDIVITAR